VILSQGLSFCL